MKFALTLAGIFVAVCLVGWVAGKVLFKKKNSSRASIDWEKLELKPGDFVVSWGMRFVGYLIQTLYGYKNPPSHNMHVHSYEEIASAEASGYRILPLKKRLKQCSRFRVYRFKKMNDVKLHKLQEESLKFTRRPYDYALYFIHVFRAMSVFVPVYLYLRIGDWQRFFILSLVILCIYFPVMRFLRKWEKMAVHCAEAESMLYKKIGMLKTWSDSTYASPPANLDILENLCNAGMAECVFDSGEKDVKQSPGFGS